VKIFLIFSLSLPIYAQNIISEVPNSQRKIALTFDACSTNMATPQYDKRITEILIKTQTPATIFLGGRWIENLEGEVIDLASSPLFELGNHSYSHPNFTKLKDQRIKEQIEWTQEALFRATGKKGKYFRPPYGEYNKRVLKIVDSFGLIPINYSLASGDPDVNSSKKRLIKWVVEQTKPGSIIIMHINKRGKYTADALPEIINILRKKGYKFVTISELLKSGEEFRNQSRNF
jgi:peptidoglycan/xylan/chitin deacetylase (PgdA/CDA1 family)